MREIIGKDDRRQRVFGEERICQHLRQSALTEVELVIAERHRIVAEIAENPKLRGIGCVDRLEKRAHGEIAAVKGDGAGGCRAFPFEQGIESRIAAGFAAVFRFDRKKMRVHVVGKQDGGRLFRHLGGRCRDLQQSGAHKQHTEEKSEDFSYRFHI